MTQIERNITDYVDGFLMHTRYLILDRDPLYTRMFRGMLKDAGVKIVRLPARSPDLNRSGKVRRAGAFQGGRRPERERGSAEGAVNSYAERWIRSVRSECLSRVIPLGERHLRSLISEYLAHYHGERNHQGLGNRLIMRPVANTNSGEGRVRRRQRVGGVLSYYYRSAA